MTNENGKWEWDSRQDGKLGVEIGSRTEMDERGNENKWEWEVGSSLFGSGNGIWESEARMGCKNGERPPSSP